MMLLFIVVLSRPGGAGMFFMATRVVEIFILKNEYIYNKKFIYIYIYIYIYINVTATQEEEQEARCSQTPSEVSTRWSNSLKKTTSFYDICCVSSSHHEWTKCEESGKWGVKLLSVILYSFHFLHLNDRVQHYENLPGETFELYFSRVYSKILYGGLTKWKGKSPWDEKRFVQYSAAEIQKCFDLVWSVSWITHLMFVMFWWAFRSLNFLHLWFYNKPSQVKNDL